MVSLIFFTIMELFFIPFTLFYCLLIVIVKLLNRWLQLLELTLFESVLHWAFKFLFLWISIKVGFINLVLLRLFFFLLNLLFDSIDHSIHLGLLFISYMVDLLKILNCFLVHLLSMNIWWLFSLNSHCFLLILIEIYHCFGIVLLILMQFVVYLLDNRESNLI